MSDIMSEAGTTVIGAPPNRALPAAIAIALLATGAVGTFAWCGILAYGTFRLITG